ncbi:predicted protein [Enterococcus faecium Com15]|jgi:hypothetical protein|nr:predicted protein [Enterococcus faecium Com12]EEV60808.1 predicted protein [Enterococcus faecium Com15]EFF62234.1 hypothetical protein CUO_1619 [Enterococcus faecium PC4.1]SJX71744.1 hypothetical protein FM130_13530 [Enterococcus faecium]
MTSNHFSNSYFPNSLTSLFVFSPMGFAATKKPLAKYSAKGLKKQIKKSFSDLIVEF